MRGRGGERERVERDVYGREMIDSGRERERWQIEQEQVEIRRVKEGWWGVWLSPSLRPWDG